ncbi:MAG: PDZ domain-containing protein, partial [Salinimicrobium sediminis]|nr:PDZ domain-containing protein [Salinimicrobium sediminis]
MKNNSKKYLPLLLGFACAIGVLIGAALDFSSYTSNSFLKPNKKKEKLARLIDYIEYEYVDDVDMDSIVDVTVNEILTDLDPHSVYIPKSEYVDLSASMKGDFVGIGVSFRNINDTIAVIQTLEGGPSEKVGIKGGDRILYANDEPLFDSNISEDSITNKLKGEENTKVVLKVHRKGEPDLLEFNVKRGKVALKSVDAVYMLTDDLGYIKINRFAESTYKEFKEGLL